MSRKARDYEKELGAIMDSLAESVADISDEELVADAHQEGRNPEVAASQIRNMLFGAVDRFERTSASPKAATTALAQGLVAKAAQLGMNVMRLADITELSPVLITMFDRRLIRLGSIPAQVLARISSALNSSAEEVAAYFTGQALFPAGEFKADRAPTLPDQQEFFEAVRRDPSIGEERKRKLLDLEAAGR